MTDAATQMSVALYNDALEELGESRVDSFTDNTPVAAAAQRRFTKVVSFMLQLYPWTWQIERQILSRVQTTPVSAYDYVFDIPTGASILAIYDDADAQYPVDPRTYRIIRAQVHSDAELLYADVRPADVAFGIASWSPSFRQAVIKGIAADACLKVGGTRTLKADLTVEAMGVPGSDYPRGGLIQAAAEEDGQQSAGGVLQLADGPLLDARRY